MKELDRQKPFGTVHGAGRAKYEQDNAYFDSEGRAIDVAEMAAEDARRAEVEERPAPKAVSLDPSDAPATPEEVAKALDSFEPVPDPQIAAQLAVGIDLDGDGKVDVTVKGGKVSKAKKKGGK